jgi:RHS repeat-associated protein
LRYKPWGETRYHSGNTPTRYQYTGQYSYTPDFGLYFYNARWYDPALGRFTQPDSLIPESSQGAQAWDRYAYVNNNPLKYTDPSGHWLETAWDILNIAWDIQAIRQDPGNLWNWGALVVDVGTALLPGVPAFAGVVSKGGKAAKAAVEVASHADEVVDAGRVVAEVASHADEAADALIDAKSASLKFGQASVGPRFTGPERSNFKYAGWSLEEVAEGLRSGKIHPDELPVRFIEREGVRYAINNRSLKALRMAGREPTILIDITGDPYYERELTRRLAEAANLSVDLNDIPIRGR